MFHSLLHKVSQYCRRACAYQCKAAWLLNSHRGIPGQYSAVDNAPPDRLNLLLAAFLLLAWYYPALNGYTAISLLPCYFTRANKGGQSGQAVCTHWKPLNTVLHGALFRQQGTLQWWQLTPAFFFFFLGEAVPKAVKSD